MGVSIAVAISFWQLAQQAYVPDYWMYVGFVENFQETGTLPRPHFLYPFLMVLVDRVLPGDRLVFASMFITVLFALAYGVVLYLLVYRVLGGGEEKRVSIVGWMVFFTAALFVAMPVVLFTLPVSNLVHGYMPVTYHNPTMTIVKPFMIPAFFMSAALLQPDKPTHRPYFVTALAVLIVLSLISKPNFVFTLLPSVMLVVAFQFVRRVPVQIGALAWGIVIPALFILGVQYVFLYASTAADAGSALASEGIAFRPFAVLDHHAANLNPYANRFILPKFVMSMLFPLCVYAVHFGSASRDLTFNLAWIFFFVSAFFGYFVVELGPSLFHGNFSWGAHMGFTILFIVATLFFLREYRSAFTESFRDALNWRFDLLFFVFLLHFISGLLWYLLHLNGKFKYMF